MKNKGKQTIGILSFLVLMSACDDFLDTMPDSRAEIDKVSKVTSLLVSAYPRNSATFIAELSSDNAKDNGKLHTSFNREQEAAYLWNDIEFNGNDTPSSVWNAHYKAIASANQALFSIEELGGQGMDAQKGEALICRAYAHFALANLFCLPYNPETAGTDLGLPYSESPEDKVIVAHTRGTMDELYRKISEDIEAALPLIDDELYLVPKYHFNTKAAHAFAARFNLFYLKFDKAVGYATAALGDNPEGVIRKWSEINELAQNYSMRCDRFITDQDPENYLIMTALSAWPYVHGPLKVGRRYGNHFDIIERESVRAEGPWALYPSGSKYNLFSANAMWGDDEKGSISKCSPHFEYTDKTTGTGYLHMVLVPFSAGETLLCRAEAQILQSNFSGGVADINSWIKANSSSFDPLTQNELVSFYDKISYMPTQVKNKSERTVKKRINPQGFTVMNGVQENLIQCVLHLRRIETIHDGGRWYDIKRYGIEIAHNRDGMPDDLLLKDDPRRAVQLPRDVINAGLEANPRN